MSVMQLRMPAVISRSPVSYTHLPYLWSAEDPALYELEIELLDDAGHLVEVTGQKVRRQRGPQQQGALCLPCTRGPRCRKDGKAVRHAAGLRADRQVQEPHSDTAGAGRPAR